MQVMLTVVETSLKINFKVFYNLKLFFCLNSQFGILAKEACLVSFFLELILVEITIYAAKKLVIRV